ncbi:MAG: coproporphyrinogen dehydrogenase HemZ, partial [Clostridiales bacterium]|nr:coproporphyrinogen dehydrogenase HemZ [Clostridiales bacterium]
MYVYDIGTNTELADVARLFFNDEFPSISIIENKGNFTVNIDGRVYEFDFTAPMYSIIPIEHKLGRTSKIALYDALSMYTDKRMPWGALTGVRPTKLFYECINAGQSLKQACLTMENVYRVSAERANILSQIAEAQVGKIYHSPEYYNLYVHIPYCTTRCTYCSFVSAPISKNSEQSKEYIRLLCDEIKRSIDFLHSNGKKILSVYIGGGTPTALDEQLFDKLLTAIGDFGCEYTCEAGRPDTVTAEKVDIMKKHGVTRVCVNPQTLNDKTLALIGRSHSSEQFFTAYNTVASRGFDINCDLIAGLDGETVDDFITSFEGVCKLSPQNITVHSLSKKNGSAIRYDSGENLQASSMLEYTLDHLGKYRPYYLYRQKRQACNLENVGLSVIGKECVNNITTMEETVGVMACGAGAISKIISADGNITRFANMRDVPLY